MVATLAVEVATDMVEGVTEGVEDIGVTKMKVGWWRICWRPWRRGIRRWWWRIPSRVS